MRPARRHERCGQEHHRYGRLPRGENLRTSWSCFDPAGVGLGLPALAGIGVAVAMIWTLVVPRMIRLLHRPTSPPENTQ
jgi:hypothetical protein